MRRFGLTASLLTSIGVLALVASCSDGIPPEPSSSGGPLPDAPVLVSGSLSGGGWTPTVVAAAGSGKVSVCHSGNGKHYTQLSLPPSAASAHLGDPNTGGGRHQYDFRVSDATPCPPPAGNVAQLQVCKVAGTGVTAGTSFTFNLTATNQQAKTVTVAAGAGPTGTCANVSGSYPVGTAVTVQEVQQQGVSTSAITVNPAGAQQGTSDLANRSAVVITGTGTTTLTFTNTTTAGGTTGTLVICKVGGTGITAGTAYTFSAGNQTATVNAGAEPNGTCGSPLTLPAGAVTVSETGNATSIVTAIAGTPAPTNVSLAGRSATTQITAGQESRITFTNVASTAANSGSLTICKVGGAGVVAGTAYSFGVAGQTVSVNAGAGPTGTCAATPITVAAGSVTITEAAQAGVVLTGVTATQGATNALTAQNLAARTATVTITAGQTTTATFTNTATASTGTLVICKIGGTGVAAGTSYSFTAGGQTATVAAGAAPNGTCGAPLTLAAGTVTVTEAAVTGTSVSAITGTPAAPTNINLGTRSAQVAIAAGQETRLTFTNVAP